MFYQPKCLFKSLNMSRGSVQVIKCLPRGSMQVKQKSKKVQNHCNKVFLIETSYEV